VILLHNEELKNHVTGNQKPLKPHHLFYLLFFFLLKNSFAQTKNLDFFLSAGIVNNPSLKESDFNTAILNLQNEIIAAQNKKPKFYLSGEYLFAPYFYDNGRIISVTADPSLGAYGYDPSITNGGLYSALVNVSLPLFNTSVIKALSEQNKIQSDANTANRLQQVHDLVKDITDKYITAYQFQQQQITTAGIVINIEDRKKIVSALVDKNLLPQTDFKLLELEINQRNSDIRQLQMSYETAYVDLKNSCGISDTSIIPLEQPVITLVQTPSEYHYLNKFKIDSMNLIMQQNVFNSKYKPELNFLGNGGLNATVADRIPHNFGISAGLNLSIPLYDGNQKNLNRQQTDLQLQIIQEKKENAAIIIQNNIQNALKQIENEKILIAQLKNDLVQRDAYLEIVKQKTVSGQSSMIDFLLSIQDEVSIQQKITEAESDLLILINQYNYYNW
jgi:outer membrane protein TolC